MKFPVNFRVTSFVVHRVSSISTDTQFNCQFNSHLLQDSEEEEEEEGSINKSRELPVDDNEQATRCLLPPGASVGIPPFPVVSSIALSKRAIDIRRRVQLRGLMQQVPSTLPVNPSAVLNLGKSIAIPATKLTGRESNH